MAGPNFIFTPTVPQSSQTISSTQAPINSNFQAINELFSVNHVSFLDPVNFGKHTYVSFQLQDTPPDTTSTQMAIFAAASGGSYGIDLFYRYPDNGSILQLTSSTGGQSANAAVNGWSYLTTTLLMKWGTTTGLIAGSQVVNFPTAGIPAFSTQVYSFQFSPAYTLTTNLNPYPYVSAYTPTTFTFVNPGTAMTSIQWVAIGV